MVEVTVEITDLEYEVMRLYNEGERIRTITRVLNISGGTYSKVFKRLKIMGLVVPRGARKRKKPQRFTNPRYYSFNTSSGYYSITKGGVYFTCMKTRRGAEQMVELLKENNWDKSKVKELKAMVIVNE